MSGSIAVVLLFLALPAGLATATADATAAQRKFDMIEGGKAPPGTRVDFTQTELISWMQQEAAALTPGAARDLRLSLGNNQATGFARINFLKLRRSESSGFSEWLLQSMVSGEKPVSVTVRFESRGGQARVTPERVEISGVAIEGRALELLIQVYLRATFPSARVNDWFPLDSHVERFTVSPGRVSVLMK